ncbi:MAG: lytic transglycosylase domain-containing protein [Alphaproteobacteria bacterium]
MRARHREGPASRLMTLAMAGVLVFGGDAVAATKNEVMRMVAEEATRNGVVPVSLALGLAKTESNFNDRAESPKGARGVMQVMPSTALGEFGVPADALWDPKLNIRLGVSYLERLYNLYGHDWNLALSHYNGGGLPARSGRYVAHDYTRGFVSDVNRWARTYSSNGIAVAMAGTSGTTVQVASVEPTPRPSHLPSANIVRSDATPEPRPEEIRHHDDEPVRIAYPADESRFRYADKLAQSTHELRGRFRTSLTRRGEVAHDDLEDAGSEEVATDTEALASPTRVGRFSYAPFGS